MRKVGHELNAGSYRNQEPLILRPEYLPEEFSDGLSMLSNERSLRPANVDHQPDRQREVVFPPKVLDRSRLSIVQENKIFGPYVQYGLAVPSGHSACHRGQDLLRRESLRAPGQCKCTEQTHRKSHAYIMSIAVSHR
jgi:hypothetical protein